MTEYEKISEDVYLLKNYMDVNCDLMDLSIQAGVVSAMPED